MAKDKPARWIERYVIVSPIVENQGPTVDGSAEEVWTFTAVVLVAGLRYAFAEATAEGLWLQI